MTGRLLAALRRPGSLPRHIAVAASIAVPAGSAFVLLIAAVADVWSPESAALLTAVVAAWIGHAAVRVAHEFLSDLFKRKDRRRSARTDA